MSNVSHLQPKRGGSIFSPLPVGPSRFELHFFPTLRMFDACQLAYVHGLIPEQRWQRDGRSRVVGIHNAHGA